MKKPQSGFSSKLNKLHVELKQHMLSESRATTLSPALGPILGFSPYMATPVYPPCHCTGVSGICLVFPTIVLQMACQSWTVPTFSAGA